MAQTLAPRHHPLVQERTTAVAVPSPTAYLDLDSVLIESRWAPRGHEFHVRPGVTEGLARLRQVVEHVVVLVEPVAAEASRRPDLRLDVLRQALGSDGKDLLVAECPHPGADASDACDCRKPGTALIDRARQMYRLGERGGWHVSGDQLGVQSGRSAGLRTVRIGPIGEDHLSVVHRADHDARDLLSAANLVMLETLTAV